MTLLDASERLSKDYFSNEVEDTELYSFYECPRCHEKVGFERKNFEKHYRSSFTNLSPEDAKHVDAFIAEQKFKQDSFLDFYCTGCHLAVRIYFSFWAGGKHGDNGFDMHKIVEFDSTSRLTNR
jgi:hypothetical protein